MRTTIFGKILYTLMLLVLQSMLFAGVASAKSAYVIANINAVPTPISAYDIQPDGTVVWQTTTNVPDWGWGAVGIAVDNAAEVLFITYEASNTIQLIDARTMADIGTTTAPGATNLAGVVLDQQNQLLYVIDRATANLYVYDWVSATTTLTLQAGFPIALSNVSDLYGIALDEINDVLYVADNHPGWVRGYETATWTEVAAFQPTDPPTGIAVDALRGFVYTVAPDATNGVCSTSVTGTSILSKYDLNTATETTSPLGHGGFGLGVDLITGYVYMTGGCSTASDNLSVWDASVAPFVEIDATTRIGDPTGLVIPIGDVSYNPLNLSKVDDVDPVLSGNDLTYTICYDNTVNQSDVTGTMITDDVPAGTTFVSATGGGIHATGTVTWDLGTLPAGASQACVQMTVNVTAPAETVLVNSATITGWIFGEVFLQTTQTETTLVGITLEELFQGEGQGEFLGSFGPFDIAIGLVAVLLGFARSRKIVIGKAFLIAGVLVVMSALVMPNRAQAIDLGWYAGAGLGGAWTGVSATELDARLAGLGYTTSSVVDDVDFGWKVFGGYQLHEYFAAELIYVDLGDVTSTISTTVPDPAQFVADAATVHPYSVNGVALAGILTWPVSDNFTVLGKFGGFRWDADIKVWCSTCLGTSTANGFDWMGGAGAEYDFANDVGVRLEWEHYATDRDDVELFSGSVLYRFK